MISIVVFDHDDGVLLTKDGHADLGEGDETGARVCAGIGTLLATSLQRLTGSIRGGGPDSFAIFFPPTHLDIASFVIEGIALVAKTYPEYAVLVRHDTRLEGARRTP